MRRERLFGPPPPVVSSVDKWIADMRRLPPAGTRPPTPDVPPVVKHQVSFEEMLAPTRRTRRIVR